MNREGRVPGAAGAVRAYVGLGSNLDGPEHRIHAALAALAQIPRIRFAGASSLYRNPALGPGEQASFVNAVAALDTEIPPLDLLDALLALEARQGRVRSGEGRWQPRTLDLDLLLYGDRRLEEPRLTVPHPALAERAFVLVPLAELAPDLVVPGLGPVSALLARAPAHPLERLEARR